MLLEFEGVTKYYGRKPALFEVSLRVQEGEVVGLAGPNGAGKTTLINLAMGFLAAQNGRISVLDDDPLTRGRLDRIGWMPEAPAFPAQMRVGEIIDLQASAFPSWDDARASELIEHLDLDPSERVKVLSRGQTGRLALLLALAHRPRLLILDDPSLGLDPAGRRLLIGEVLAASAEEGTGILLSTHLLNEAEQALDRLVILTQGRVTLDETIDDLKRRPLEAGEGGFGAPAPDLEQIYIQETGASE